MNIIKNLDIQHVSTYGLKIEEGSYFYKHIPQNLPNDDEQADFYEFINDYIITSCDYLPYKYSSLFI